MSSDTTKASQTVNKLLNLKLPSDHINWESLKSLLDEDNYNCRAVISQRAFMRRDLSEPKKQEAGTHFLKPFLAPMGEKYVVKCEEDIFSQYFFFKILPHDF